MGDGDSRRHTAATTSASQKDIVASVAINASRSPSFCCFADQPLGFAFSPRLYKPADEYGLGPQLVTRSICPIAKYGTPERNRA